MFCFVTALKAKTVANDWPAVSACFSRTLRSVFNQTDPDFKIIAVVHDRPELSAVFDDRLVWIDADFPPPQRRATELTMRDKWRKITLGLVRARAFSPHFLMIIDADDLVSRRLVEHAHCHPRSNGWIIEKGYRFRPGTRAFQFDEHFNCGTNAIVNARHVNLPPDTSVAAVRDCILLTTGHTGIARAMSDRGALLESLPFPGAVYVTGHGDNDSDLIGDAARHGLRYRLGALRRRRSLTPALRNEFALTLPS